MPTLQSSQQRSPLTPKELCILDTRNTSLLTTLLTALGAVAASAVLALSQAEPAALQQHHQQQQDQQSLRVSSSELIMSTLPASKS